MEYINLDVRKMTALCAYSDISHIYTLGIHEYIINISLWPWATSGEERGLICAYLTVDGPILKKIYIYPYFFLICNQINK